MPKIEMRGDVLAVTLSESVSEEVLATIAESEKEVVDGGTVFLLKSDNAEALERLKQIDESASELVEEFIAEQTKTEAEPAAPAANETDLQARSGEETETTKPAADEPESEEPAANQADPAVAQKAALDATAPPEYKGLGEEEEPAEKTEESKPEGEQLELALEHVEVTGKAREVKKLLKGIEGVVVESIDGDFLAVKYPAGKRADVVTALGDKVVSEDAQLVKADAGKSLYRVLVESGFTQENIGAMASIFQSAVSDRIAAREAEFETRVAEEVERRFDEIADAVDTVVAESTADWLTENKPTIAANLRLQKAEQLFEAVKELFAATPFALPESQVSAFDELVEANESLKAELTARDEKITQLQESVDATDRSKLIDKIVEDRKLSLAQRERLEKMLESVDLSSFEERATLVVESFFETKKPSAPRADDTVDPKDVLTEGVVDTKPAAKKPDPYASTLKRMNRGFIPH